jgi:hypothetical protein
VLFLCGDVTGLVVTERELIDTPKIVITRHARGRCATLAGSELIVIIRFCNVVILHVSLRAFLDTYYAPVLLQHKDAIY